MAGKVAITVGVPVYNGASTISQVVKGLLDQSFRNLEIVISDNCSTDETGDICRAICSVDKRVIYRRRDRNIGAAGNFKSLLEDARGRYFLFAAADDIRSTDFLEINYNFLEANSDYVASACPNRFRGEGEDKNITFSLDGTMPERFHEFFKNCWVSHGVFYSLIRTDVIKRCDAVGASFWAADWAVNLFLLANGKINRSASGWTEFGRSGVSNSVNPYRHFRSQRVDIVLPYYQMSRYAWRLSASFSRSDRIRLLGTLMMLNLTTSRDRFLSGLYRVYKRR